MVQYKQDTKNIWFPKQVEPVYDPSDPNVIPPMDDGEVYSIFKAARFFR